MEVKNLNNKVLHCILSIFDILIILFLGTKKNIIYCVTYSGVRVSILCLFTIILIYKLYKKGIKNLFEEKKNSEFMIENSDDMKKYGLFFLEVIGIVVLLDITLDNIRQIRYYKNSTQLLIVTVIFDLIFFAVQIYFSRRGQEFSQSTDKEKYSN